MTDPAQRFVGALGAGEAPASFDTPGTEAEAVRAGCGLSLRPGRRTFVVGGADRHAFLNRMLTTAVRERPFGEGRRTLLLDNKGRLQADLDLLEAGEGLLAIAETEPAARAIEGLRRFVLRADVTLDARPDRILALTGPGGASLAESLGTSLPDARPSLARAELAGRAVTVMATSALPAGHEIAVGPDDAEAVATALLKAGATPVGAGVLEVLRVEAGVPAADRELADAPFPQEVRLEAAVDFDKGCYVGQETVARIHYRGQVNRLLCGLELEAPANGVELEHEGRPAGRVTSAACSDRFGPIALAMVRTERAEVGTRLRLLPGPAGGEAIGARVVALPLG